MSTNASKADRPAQPEAKTSAAATGLSPALQAMDNQARGLTPQRIDELRQGAHAVLDDKLTQRFKRLEGRARVTEEELEGEVKGCVEEVGQWLLGKLLEWEPWVAEAEQATEWPCPDCGQLAPRATDKKGQPRWDQIQLETKLGPVTWRAPLFACKRCRRSFSPGASVLRTRA